MGEVHIEQFFLHFFLFFVFTLYGLCIGCHFGFSSELVILLHILHCLLILITLMSTCSGHPLFSIGVLVQFARVEGLM